MDKSSLRWGILGTADIARKNWMAIRNSGNGHITAVASRDLQRGRQFVHECQAQAPFQAAPRALGSYEEVLAAADVDAVYIPLPTAIRGHWVKRAAEAGKHVLCEKPCAPTVAELTEMLDACQRNQVQFMDGVMFMHSSRLERMRQVLDDGQTVGTIRRIGSAFSFSAGEEFFASNIRAQGDLEPHGCLGDLGWYCIRFSLWAMNRQLPRRVTAQILSDFKHPDSKFPVPTEFSAELFFEGGVTSSFYCSFLAENDQWARVSGAKGHLWVPDFVLPFSGPELFFETGTPRLEVHGGDFEMQPRQRHWSIAERSHSDVTAQESQMFRNFASQVQSGTLNPSWPEIALKTQTVLQACRESALAQGRPVKSDIALA